MTESYTTRLNWGTGHPPEPDLEAALDHASRCDRELRRLREAGADRARVERAEAASNKAWELVGELDRPKSHPVAA